MFIIIDTLLRNQSGHQFIYTAALKQELEKRGHCVSVLGNLSADQHCLKMGNFFPVFTDIISYFFRAPLFLINPFGAFRQIGLLKSQFDKNLFGNTDFKINEGDILFSHSLYAVELISFGWFLRNRTKELREKKARIFIGLNFSYVRSSGLATLLFMFLYRLIFLPMVRKLDSQIIYFCDGEQIRIKFEQLFKRKVYFLPPPISNKLMDDRIREDGKDINEGFPVMAYLGGARYNKGFDIFIRMIKRFLNEGAILSRVRIRVQADIHSQQPKRDKNAVTKAAEELNMLANENEAVEIIRGPLLAGEYYKALLDSDIVVLPYRAEGFSLLPSNIFRETIVSGAVPVVSNDTCMSEILKEYDLGVLVFGLDDAGEFLRVMNEVIPNIRDYKTRLKPVRDEWRRIYSVSNLVDKITILLGEQKHLQQ